MSSRSDPPALRLPLLLGFLAVGLLPLVYGAIRAFPIWDDGTLMLLLKEHGPDSFYGGSMQDRPVSGYLLYLLARTSSMKMATLFFHIPMWILTGLITASLWRIIFPRYRQYAPFAALLAISPIVAETQLILIVVPTIHQLSTVTVFLAFLLCHDGRTRSAARFYAALALSTVLVFFGIVISEYGVAALIATTTLFVGLEWLQPRPDLRRRTRTIVGTMLAVGVAGYVTYHALAVGVARESVRPELQLKAQGLKRLVELPLRIPAALWNGTFGELLKKAGQVDVRSGNGPALLFGALMLALALVLLRRAGAPDRDAATAGTTHQGPTGERRSLLSRWRHPVLVLIAASMLPLVPIMVMKASPRSGCLSRMWTPVIPVLSLLTVYALVAGFAGRARAIVLLAFTFVLGFTSMNLSRASVRTRDQVVQDGAAVKPYLAPAGLTVAIYTKYTGLSLGSDDNPDPGELTWRMTEGWTPDERKRFFATAYDYVSAGEVMPTLDKFGVFSGEHTRLTYIGFPQGGLEGARRGTGFVHRRGDIAKILWLARTADGRLMITPQVVGAR